MVKPKLSLSRRGDEEVLKLTRVIIDRVGENATTFAEPKPTPASLASQADALEALINSRNALQAQLQALALQIREKMDTLKLDLTLLADYVHSIAKGDASIPTRSN